jgi:hypothetical protein
MTNAIKVLMQMQSGFVQLESTLCIMYGMYILYLMWYIGVTHDIWY